MHWRKYKDIVARANVVCWEVVVEITRTSRSQEPVGIVDEVPFRIENNLHVFLFTHIVTIFVILSYVYCLTFIG